MHAHEPQLRDRRLAGTRFAGWSQYGTTGTSTAAIHGSVAARVSGLNNGTWDFSRYWQQIACDAGEQWTGSVYVMVPAGSPLTGLSKALVNVEWRDSGGNLISYDSFTAADASTPTDAGRVFTFTSSAGADRDRGAAPPGRDAAAARPAGADRGLRPGHALQPRLADGGGVAVGRLPQRAHRHLRRPHLAREGPRLLRARAELLRRHRRLRLGGHRRPAAPDDQEDRQHVVLHRGDAGGAAGLRRLRLHDARAPGHAGPAGRARPVHLGIRPVLRRRLPVVEPLQRGGRRDQPLGHARQRGGAVRRPALGVVREPRALRRDLQRRRRSPATPSAGCPTRSSSAPGAAGPPTRRRPRRSTRGPTPSGTSRARSSRAST